MLTAYMLNSKHTKTKYLVCKHTHSIDCQQIFIFFTSQTTVTILKNKQTL